MFSEKIIWKFSPNVVDTQVIESMDHRGSIGMVYIGDN